MQGEANLTDNQFGKRNIHHLFCVTCGIKLFARGQGPTGPMVVINARCLDGIDLDTIDVRKFDGKSH